MCGGKLRGLFGGGIKDFGKNLQNYSKDQAAENSPEAKQSKQDNAQAAMKKRRASEVLSAGDSNKKSTLGG
ncbi:hypothetical protein [Acinetobacter sp. 197]|uniref:hypothetical protein n=1 Tax=Acinetobacter sp. 197 TaxID=3114696 RepID=UPI003A8C4B26